MSSKKKPKHRIDIERPHCGGEWSDARFRSFIMSALRRAQWPVKYQVLKGAFVELGVNPATGRTCKLHRCEECQNLFPQKEMRIDHRAPVIPLLHDWGGNPGSFLNYDWNQVIQRLYCEADNFQVVCNGCHATKSAEEKTARKMQWDADGVPDSPV